MTPLLDACTQRRRGALSDWRAPGACLCRCRTACPPGRARARHDPPIHTRLHSPACTRRAALSMHSHRRTCDRGVSCPCAAPEVSHVERARAAGSTRSCRRTCGRSSAFCWSRSRCMTSATMTIAAGLSLFLSLSLYLSVSLSLYLSVSLSLCLCLCLCLCVCVQARGASLSICVCV